MTPFRFYSGFADGGPGPPLELPTLDRPAETDPRGYLADAGLVDAVNVALLLGQPLLLTGEPGTGKTQLASSLAAELRLGSPLKFETRSTTVAADLFYTYNALARLHAAQSGGSNNVLDYLTFNALGWSIIRTNQPERVADLLRDPAEHVAPCRSVVLIDEVDKAPRDFPNDILNELEGAYFRIPELGGRRVDADPAFQPVIVITSNSEKNLPDAFLRRCVYYNIPFPQPDRLREIVLSRLRDVAGQPEFLTAALGLFYELRNPATGLRKKPATAELLGWVRAVRHLAIDETNPFQSAPLERILGTLVTLAKTPDDQERVRGIAEAWLGKKL